MSTLFWSSSIAWIWFLFFENSSENFVLRYITFFRVVVKGSFGFSYFSSSLSKSSRVQCWYFLTQRSESIDYIDLVLRFISISRAKLLRLPLVADEVNISDSELSLICGCP
jgi:hypothetical protein